MKTYKIPCITGYKNKWSGVIDIYNDSAKVIIVDVMLYNHCDTRCLIQQEKSILQKEMSFEISPFDSAIMKSSELLPGRQVVEISLPECAMLTVYQFSKGGVTEKAYYETQPRVLLETDETPKKWLSNEFINFVGKSACGYGKTYMIGKINYISKWLARDFPDRVDNRVWVGDGTPSNYFGSCSGHHGSHSKLKAFDYNYFTHNGNATQYKDIGDELSIIWQDRKLIEGMIDYEKNYHFMKRLFDIFPRATAIINTDIWQYVMTRIPDARQLNNRLSLDSGTSYNHQFHVHVDIGIDI